MYTEFEMPCFLANSSEQRIAAAAPQVTVIIDGAKGVGGAVGETAGGLIKGIKGILPKGDKK